MFTQKSQILTDFSPASKLEPIEKVQAVAAAERTELITSKVYSVSTSQLRTSQSVSSKTSATSSNSGLVNVASAIKSTNHITIAGATIPIFASSNTNIDAGTQVGSFKKLLYGHNSGTVFGRFANVSTGTTFTATLNGTTTTYRISQKLTVEKSSLEVNNRMNYLVNSASYTDQNAGISTGSHDLVLMTCAGTLYGNGDASHRILVFADKI